MPLSLPDGGETRFGVQPEVVQRLDRFPRNHPTRRPDVPVIERGWLGPLFACRRSRVSRLVDQTIEIELMRLEKGRQFWRGGVGSNEHGGGRAKIDQLPGLTLRDEFDEVCMVGSLGHAARQAGHDRLNPVLVQHGFPDGRVSRVGIVWVGAQ